jgi:hypothetical protein
MAKKRTKTDFTEQIERQKQFRAYLARKEEEKKKREQGAAEQKES